jgi:hypothetical protein
MSGSRTMPKSRRKVAERALAELQGHRSDHQRLGVQCRHAHHVAGVFETPEGLVYVARTGPHSHGSKDLPDTGKHGARPGQEYVDLLRAEATAGDELPAWCDCGPQSLSRTELIDAARAGVHTVRLP